MEMWQVVERLRKSKAEQEAAHQEAERVAKVAAENATRDGRECGSPTRAQRIGAGHFLRWARFRASRLFQRLASARGIIGIF